MANERTRRAGPRALAAPKPAKKKQISITPSQRAEAGEEGRVPNNWRTYFLQALAETSNIALSAQRAGIAPSRAYKARREDPEFAGKWREALLEGYDLLEMEVLGWLRTPDPSRKVDVAAAIRLLGAHRETVERHRALEEEENEQAVRESIDAFLEGLRQRRLAKEASLIETQAPDVAG
jgi:hypothetical protein